MEKQIAFNEGLVSTPYSDVSPDGQLSMMHGVEVHAGSVRPSKLLGNEIQLGGVLLFIHKTGDYTHYIYKATENNLDNPALERGALCFFSPETLNQEAQIGVVLDKINAQEILNITNTGHILTVACKNKELQYIIWQDGAYHYLGIMPELDISFGLVLENRSELMGAKKVEVWGTVTAEERFNYWASLIGKFLDTHNRNFVVPFFVRAAYRLYDGTYVKLTPPVLMMPNTNAPYITGTHEENVHIEGESGTHEAYRWSVHAFIASLEYQINNIPREWNNVITDVCIFISQLNLFDYEYDKKIANNVANVTENYGYGRLDSTLSYAKLSDLPDSNTHDYILRLHYKNDLDIESNVDTAVFKEFKRIPILEIKNTDILSFARNTNLEIVENSAKELIDNDYGKDTITPQGIYMYNKRLNIFNLNIKQYIADIDRKSEQLITNSNNEYCNLYIRLQKYDNDTDVYLIQNNANFKQFEKIFFYYAHHTNAIGLIIEKNINGVLKYDELKLKKALTLNGVFFIDVIGYEPTFENEVDYEVNDDLPQETFSNYLYSSQTNNPFVFPAKGRNAVGCGSITNICTATKPLSEGQVGDFPLIVFCDDGNYALSIIKTGEDAGLFDSITPAKPDVAVNKNIVGTEEGILFVSNQGLMLMSRNEAILLSGKLDGPHDTFELQTNGGRINAPTTNSDIDHGTLTYTSSVSTSGDWEELCEVTLVSGNSYKLTIDCETFVGGRGGDYYISLKEGDNIITENHIIRKHLEIEWLSKAENNPVKLFIKLKYTASGAGLLDNHTVGYSLVLVKDNNQGGSGNEPDPHSGGEIGGDDGIYYDDNFDSIVLEDFENYSPREFIKGCITLLDYTNKRIFITKVGCKKAYVLNYAEGTFSTIDFGKYVRTSINCYPFGYLQFVDNTTISLGQCYDFVNESEHGQSGMIVTRPLKLDTLLLKRMNEFALHGNFSEDQTITVYGSNDLKTWNKVGTTSRRHVRNMRGYYYKYWRFKIETKLKENENISSVEVKYSVKQDGRLG